jgi:hypothetical protein
MSSVDVNRLASDALLVARIVDAASHVPRPVRDASTASPYAWAHVATGGYLVLSGRPELALPDLATTSRDIGARLEFDDRGPLDLQFTIPAGSSLPFRPGDVEVALPPAGLTGTITDAAFPNPPIAGATIAITAASPPPLLGLRTPLSLVHPSGASVRARTITAAAVATSLAEAADQGATAVTVLSTAGCAAGAVLELGDDPSLEHVVITAVDGALALVSLAVPLRRSRAAGARTRAYTLTAAGAPSTLAREAAAGDGVLEVTPAVVGDVVEVGGPTSELRATNAVTDAAGRWRLDGVRSIGRLELTVSATGYVTSTPLAYDVDYHRPNLIDLRLSV